MQSAEGQAKRLRHSTKISNLKKSKSEGVKEALGLMETIPVEDRNDFVAAIKELKSKASRDVAIAEHNAASAAEDMDVQPSVDAQKSTVLLEEMAKAQREISEAKVCRRSRPCSTHLSS